MPKKGIIDWDIIRTKIESKLKNRVDNFIATIRNRRKL